jgi:tRNA-binding EMAP/Myf-like protein
VIIRIAGAIVGRAVDVLAHPRGDFIWLAKVDLGERTPPAQIVFGGERPDIAGEYVPVAPPGARVTVRGADGTERLKKMRARSYRGQRSFGMLCSLDELGWLSGGPNEVAILQNLTLGQSLDDISSDKWSYVVADWSRAQAMAGAAVLV